MPTAPTTLDGFRAQLQDLMPTLPKRMKQCAEYLGANPERIAVSTVAELAAGAEVQPSALMRFCQLMGFSGFSDMQKMFREVYSPALPDYGTRLSNLRDRGAGSPSALLAEFVDAGRMSLENLTHTVDSRVLDQSVEALASAQMIHVVGLRRAFPVASYLSYAFEKMGIAAMLHDGTGKLDHSHAVRARRCGDRHHLCPLQHRNRRHGPGRRRPWPARGGHHRHRDEPGAIARHSALVGVRGRLLVLSARSRPPCPLRSPLRWLLARGARVKIEFKACILPF